MLLVGMNLCAFGAASADPIYYVTDRKGAPDEPLLQVEAHPKICARKQHFYGPFRQNYVTYGKADFDGRWQLEKLEGLSRIPIQSDRTARGKSFGRRNAVKHGLMVNYATDFEVHEEDSNAYQALLNSLWT